MQWEKTPLDGLLVMTTPVYGDERGHFMETYRADTLASVVGSDIRFIQDNQSYSKQKGTLRGIHFQKTPFAQTKLVRCVTGTLYDVAVDLRAGSPTFGQWFGIELSAQNAKQLFIPSGFGHGFLTLTDDVIIAYKVDAPYHKESEGTLRWDDPDVGVVWPMEPVVMSERDRKITTSLQSLLKEFCQG
jgi:dTDP-4-dehydrorhamnose 3,5-epimerase